MIDAAHIPGEVERHIKLSSPADIAIARLHGACTMGNPPARADIDLIEAALRPAPSEEQVERAHELRVLAQLLIEPRNRFGKIEARSAVAGNISDLAKKYNIRPCEDTVEQVGEILRKMASAEAQPGERP